MCFNCKINKIYNMNNLYKSLILIALLMCLGASYYIYKTSTFVTAEFHNLRPFHDRAPIYYNGFKIGKVVRVRPNDDYTAIIVTLWLQPQDLKLPTNVGVILKKEKDRHDKKFDYIDIIYPKEPSGFFLKDGDRVAGKTTVELESYLANQDPESLEAIKSDFAETVKNLNITVQTLGDLFGTLNSMAEEVKPNIVKASSNLTTTTNNLVKVSNSANKALSEERMNTTARNVQIISKNMKLMTHELNKTMPQVQCTIQKANKVLCNVDEMTSGLNCTMKKPFGGFRLFFGSPICKNRCK